MCRLDRAINPKLYAIIAIGCVLKLKKKHDLVIIVFGLGKIKGERERAIHTPTQVELRSYWLLVLVLVLERPLKHSKRDTF